ncbi:MAG: type I-E CRISPR-associated protein Cas5/CasD [Acidobacteria bacterium]|nr:MAG: type I-E CRISPR-associated protein Cas5/CasD [Acidobacteriota bacterium]
MSGETHRTSVLVCRLFGPFASWGEVAVGEVRPSAARPTRSALLGLLAAALGLRREDDDAHAALAAGVRLGVRVDAPGQPLVDYHTANYRRPKRRELILTRADELRVPRSELQTVQSRRHYRCDALLSIAVLATPAARWSLDHLRVALERPVFPLSLGRKACVPALPLAPELLRAGNLAEAFALYDERRPVPAELRRLSRRAGAVELAWDEDLGLEPGLPHGATELIERRDEPLSRRRWRFALRREAVGHLQLGQSPRKEDGDVPEPTHDG